MRAGLCCFLVLFLHIVSLVGVSSGPFEPHDHGFAVNVQGKLKNPNSLGSIKKGMELVQELEEKKEIKKIGSSPPSCYHKCNGCSPCQAIQVPTSSSHLGVQYTNYEPESWKCKCGPTLFSP